MRAAKKSWQCGENSASLPAADIGCTLLRGCQRQKYMKIPDFQAQVQAKMLLRSTRACYFPPKTDF
jgi:hypothetical protein